MDKGLGNESSSISSHFSPAPITTTTTTTTTTDMFLKQLNKNSHKIAKPLRKPTPLPNPTIAAPSSAVDPNPLNPGLGQGPPHSQQPPVYNINKSDFRDVVQKLTGFPTPPRLPPPPLAHSRPPSSRLQRIRPPPLDYFGNRPSQILPGPHYGPALPPLPPVHAAAESPISAYMRFIQNPTYSAAPWSGVPQNEFAQRPPPESPVSSYLRSLQNPGDSMSDPPQPPTQQPPAPSAPLPATPLSPLPFGCIPSPRSPYGMMARGFPFSPMAQLGLPQQLPPLSPTPPVSSPTLKGV